VARRAQGVRDVRQYHTADYLLGTPLLADFLEEGLAQFARLRMIRARPDVRAVRGSLRADQCAIKTGRVISSRIVRVAPPSTSSRVRECA
jgi:hypothetical protein